MEVKFTTETSLYGQEVVVAYVETTEGVEVLGKHYKESGLSWNIPTSIRYEASLDEWKKNVLNNKPVF